MQCSILYIFLLCSASLSFAQSEEFNQWQSSYNDYKTNFEKNISEPLHPKLQIIPDKYFTSDSIPEWLFDINHSANGYLFSVGISDPFIDSETAYQQALSRAIFTLALEMKTVVNGMNELYSNIEENGKSNGNVYTEYYQLLSKELIDYKYLSIVHKKILKTGECIVKFKYAPVVAIDSGFNTFVNLEYYRQEKSLDLNYETTEKISYSGNSMTGAGPSTTCSFTMKKHNDKTDLLSECPQNIQYSVPQFNYRIGKSTLTTTNGLWSLFIDKFTTKIISSSQVSSSIIKNVQDDYGSLNNQLTREIVVNQGNFHIARTDSALNIVFVNETNSNLIHDIKEGCITTWHTNGIKKTEEYYANDLLDGTQREWTANDKLISEISYSNGIFDGHYQLWFDNLQLREFKNYNHGLLIDKHSIWTENGQLILQEEFNSNGIACGHYFEYYPSGQIRTRGQYKKGKKTGCFISFAENGKKIKKEVYKKGILKNTTSYQ